MAIWPSDLLRPMPTGIDAGSPSLVSAVATMDGLFVEATFDREIDTTSLGAGLYHITDGIVIGSVTQPTPGLLRLSVSAMTQGHVYVFQALPGVKSQAGGVTQTTQSQSFSGIAVPAGKRRFENQNWLSPRSFRSSAAWGVRVQGGKQRTF